MDGATILVGLAAIGGTSTVTVLVQGLLNRRKLGADATKIITDAAAGVVVTLNVENKRLDDEIADLRKENTVLRKALAAQRAWGLGAQREVNRLGGHLAQPPRLPPEWES